MFCFSSCCVGIIVVTFLQMREPLLFLMCFFIQLCVLIHADELWHSVVVACVRNWQRWRHLRKFSVIKLTACRTTLMLVHRQSHNILFTTVSYICHFCLCVLLCTVANYCYSVICMRLTRFCAGTNNITFNSGVMGLLALKMLLEMNVNGTVFQLIMRIWMENWMMSANIQRMVLYQTGSSKHFHHILTPAVIDTTIRTLASL